MKKQDVFVYLETGHEKRELLMNFLGKLAMVEAAVFIRETGFLDYSP